MNIVIKESDFGLKETDFGSRNNETIGFDYLKKWM